MYTNATERMRITSAGNMAFNATSTSSKYTFSDTSASGYEMNFPGTVQLESFNRATAQYVSNVNYAANYRWFVGTGGTTRAMDIDSSGNVGIGTSSPSQKLDIGGGGNLRLSGASTGDQSIRVGTSRSGNGYSFIDLQGDTTYDNGLRIIRTNGGANTPSHIEHRGTGALSLITQEAGPITFLTSATERMRLLSGGELLVGSTTNNGRVCAHQLGSEDVYFARIGSAGSALTVSGSASTMTAGYFVTSSGLAGSITCSGTATSYNTSSDVRLKHDIVNAPEASNIIDAIQVRSFKWNADNSEQRYGFVAQELVEVAPEAVSQPEDPDEMMGVDYSKLVPILVKEIQSLRARVAQLEGN